MLSLVIPVYRNEENLDRLLAELCALRSRLQDGLEVVFVVDGSPDRSLEILRERLPKEPLQSQLVSLSRNFGSFSAILAGLTVGAGDHFAVMAADLQEPPDLVLRFHQILKSNAADIVFGCRSKRSDPWLSDVASSLFWLIYRKLVVKEMPKGGVDMFACTREVREERAAYLHRPESERAVLLRLSSQAFRLVYSGALESLGAHTRRPGVHRRFHLLPPADLQEAVQSEYAVVLSAAKDPEP